MQKLPAIKTKHLIVFMERNGWTLKRTEGSHRVFAKLGNKDYVVAFHDNK